MSWKFHPALFASALLALALTSPEVLAQGQSSVANPKAGVPPQLPPLPPSPIDYFRKLIEASPAEREPLLAGKSPEHRRVLTNSLRTYLVLTPEQRAARLRTMELRYYLTPLLQAPASNRVQRLALVPDAYRPLVAERLTYWDQLAPDMQKQLMESERAIRIGAGTVLTPPMPPLPTPLPRGFTSNQLAAADKDFARLQGYPESKRQEILAKWQKIIFELPSAQKEKELKPLPLSDAERAQIEQTLEKYSQLQPAQRTLVMKTFARFAELTAEERRQFLRNAESWQAMPPADRERWREIVNKMPPLPPLPPGFGGPPLPPLPPKRAPQTLLTTTNYP
jgi:hypothetical protein